MGADTHRPEPIAPPGGLRRIIARDGWAVGAAAAATIGVEVGVYVLALSAGAPRLHAALATLAVATLWTALAAPVLAAEAADGLGAVLRAGIVADASAVALIVLWLSCPQVGLLGAVKIYCILAAMTLPAMAVSRLACGPGGRFALAVATATGFVAALASPFWIGGALRVASRRATGMISAAAVNVNPFYAVTAAISDSARFVWHQAPVMYRITRIGDYAVSIPHWYVPVLLCCAAAAVFAALAVVLRHRRSAAAS